MTHVELPSDELIDAWVLIREIARTVVPHLKPNASGIECIVAKKPMSLGVIGIGEVPFVEQALTDDDRRYLMCVLPALPELRIPYSDEYADAFLDAWRVLSDRPVWEPVLLTESRYLQEYDRLIGARWQIAGEHLQVLQHWVDTGQIRAFRSVDCQLRWPPERQLSWPVGGVSCRCSARHSCRSFRFGLG